MKVRTVAELMRAKDLKPGDLFSTVGHHYWSDAMDRGSIGERVYIRTNMDAESAPDSDEMICRITIIQEEK